MHQQEIPKKKQQNTLKKIRKKWNKWQTHGSGGDYNLHINPRLDELTHCGLMTPYGDIDLGQHWLR